jgi:hypothetical protein
MNTEDKNQEQSLAILEKEAAIEEIFGSEENAVKTTETNQRFCAIV